MRKSPFVLLATVLLTSPGLDPDPSTAPDNRAQMQKLSWMIGAWVGDGEMPGYGKYTFRYALSWTLNQNFIEQDYTMKVGNLIAWHNTGMIGWDVDKREFATFTFGIDGSIGRGRQIDPKTVGIQGVKGVEQALVFEGGTTGNSPFRRYRFLIMKGKDDTLVIETLTLHKGKFVSMGKTVAKREKKSPSLVSKQQAKPTLRRAH